MNNRAVTTTTIGYICWALMGWMACIPDTGLLGDAAQVHGAAAIAYPLAIVLAVMGILAYMQGRSLDSTVFLGGTAFFWTQSTVSAGAMVPDSYASWYLLVWVVFFAYVWFGSLKTDKMRMLFLLGLWLSLLATTIGIWGGGGIFMMLGGYLGLASSILAAIVSARAIMDHGAGGDPNRAG